VVGYFGYARFFRRWGVNVDLTDILGMHYWASEKFNPAQLLTYMFMHGGFNHIFFNMFALYMFGGALETPGVDAVSCFTI